MNQMYTMCICSTKKHKLFNTNQKINLNKKKKKTKIKLYSPLLARFPKDKAEHICKSSRSGPELSHWRNRFIITSSPNNGSMLPSNKNKSFKFYKNFYKIFMNFVPTTHSRGNNNFQYGSFTSTIGLNYTLFTINWRF